MSYLNQRLDLKGWLLFLNLSRVIYSGEFILLKSGVELIMEFGTWRYYYIRVVFTLWPLNLFLMQILNSFIVFCILIVINLPPDWFPFNWDIYETVIWKIFCVYLEARFSINLLCFIWFFVELDLGVKLLDWVFNLHISIGHLPGTLILLIGLLNWIFRNFIFLHKE